MVSFWNHLNALRMLETRQRYQTLGWEETVVVSRAGCEGEALCEGEILCEGECRGSARGSARGCRASRVSAVSCCVALSVARSCKPVCLVAWLDWSGPPL